MIVKDLDAEKLAMKARDSLSSYCYLECSAYCCRRGYLLLSASEVKLMQNTNIKDLKIIPVKTKFERKKYIFNLGLKRNGCKQNGCPNLLDYKCTIHKNPLRPKACKEFPLFIWKNKTILVTDECPAVKENKLYPFLAEFKMRGYTIIYSS